MARPYQVVITDEAKESLKKITEYLRDNVSIETARKVKDGIDNTIVSLNNMPHRHSLLKGLYTEKIKLRRVLKWSYRIIYTIEEDKLMVIIIDIDHEKQNPERLKRLLKRF